MYALIAGVTDIKETRCLTQEAYKTSKRDRQLNNHHIFMKTRTAVNIQSACEITVLGGAREVILEAAKAHSSWILKYG